MVRFPKRIHWLLVLLLLAADTTPPVAAAKLADDEGSPIAKVVQLIGKLQDELISQGEEAQKVYTKFSQWCEARSKELSFEIKTEKGDIAELNSVINEERSVMDALTAKIEDLASTISQKDKELKESTAIRETEKADFVDEEKELVSTTKMLQRAIDILEREMAKSSGASLLQLKRAGSIEEALAALLTASEVEDADASQLMVLLQGAKDASEKASKRQAQRQAEAADSADDAAMGTGEDEVSDSVGAPAAASSKGQSGQIINTCEDLHDKAETQLGALRKKESDAVHTFALFKQGMEGELVNLNKDLDEAKKNMALRGEAISAAQGNLEPTIKDLKADVAALEELHHDCMSQAQDFEAETKSREEESKALSQAKKIIKEATSSEDKQSELIQDDSEDVDADEDVPSGLAFFQLRIRAGLKLKSKSHQKRAIDKNRLEDKVTIFVKSLARRQRNKSLMQLASRISSVVRMGTIGGADPFSKVRTLVSDMVVKLEKEGEQDATQKDYCDRELGNSQESEEEKTTNVDKLQTKLNQMSAQSAQLKEEIALLQKELAEIADSQKALDKIREDQRKSFLKEQPEMQKGMEGVKKALAVLRDYYAKGSKTASGGGAADAILSLLEVIESDYTKGLAEIVATEELSNREYNKERHENDLVIKAKSIDVKAKSQQAAVLDKAAAEVTGDLGSVQQELDAIKMTLQNLKEQCLAKPETHEERTKRRNAAIAGLKEALGILKGGAAASFLQVRQ